MLKRIRKYAQEEDGAVTVDWVVLTAAVVGLAGAATLSIHGGTESVGTSVGTSLTNVTVDSGL